MPSTPASIANILDMLTHSRRYHSTSDDRPGWDKDFTMPLHQSRCLCTGSSPCHDAHCNHDANSHVPTALSRPMACRMKPACHAGEDTWRRPRNVPFQCWVPLPPYERAIEGVPTAAS